MQRKRFYVSLTLDGAERREATKAAIAVLAAEVNEDHRAEELARELGLVDPETDPCPPPSSSN